MTNMALSNLDNLKFFDFFYLLDLGLAFYGHLRSTEMLSN